MNITIKKPYPDDLLKFNEKTHRYELTIQFVKNNFDINFKNDQVLLRRLEKNSRIVYNWIYYHSYSGNRNILEFLLNHTEQGRRMLLDALESQIEADLMSGYNDLVDTPAINVSNGQIIDRNEIARNQISVGTEQILESSESYFGANIIIQAPFGNLLRLQLMNFIKNI